MTDVVTCELESSDGVRWQVQGGTFSERLNEPFTLNLGLKTMEMYAKPNRLLGTTCSLILSRGSSVRRITGVVTKVTEGSISNFHISTTIIIEPALNALGLRKDTRIFQNISVPRILEEVLRNAFEGWDNRTVAFSPHRSYLDCDYRVQYNETDLDFCHRLMEQEGITYWFEFDGDKEKMILADDPSAWSMIEATNESVSEETLLFVAARSGSRLKEGVLSFQTVSSIGSRKVATKFFDWATASILNGETDSSGETSALDEVYEHDQRPLNREPGGLIYGNDLDDQVKIRGEEQAFSHHLFKGSSTVTSMRTGGVFELIGHPNFELDGMYRVVSATHSFDPASDHYENSFTCIPADTPWRPPRKTPRPRIASVQTAIVVGRWGEEIETDEHGRIKVQFHWDRNEHNDDRSSCWIRVMQQWAGAGWGYLFIPRIGMEVMVDFINGDIDRPLIVGALYNGANPPPYPVDEKTKSTIKSNSSLGGDGFNELRFEDAQGNEEVWLHAQRDFNEVIKNDHTTTVGHDQTIVVHDDQSQEVRNNQGESIDGDQSLEVSGNRSIDIKAGTFTETISKNETRTVTGASTRSVSNGGKRTVDGGLTETVNGARKQSVVGDVSSNVTGTLSQTVQGGIDVVHTAGSKLNVAGALEFNTNGTLNIIAPGSYKIIAPGSLKTFDGSMNLLGGVFMDNFVLKAEFHMGKFETTGLNIGIVSNHIDSANTKAATGGIWLETATSKMKTKGNILKKLAVSIGTQGFKCIT